MLPPAHHSSERLPEATGGSDPVSRTALLEVRDLEKRFGGVRALSGARFTLQAPGAVHGLIGENGSGKSTLLGVLSGQLRPDSGTVHIDGRPVTFSDPPAAIANGIVMVSQEIAVAPHLTVAENILLGRRLVRRAAGIDWRATRARAVAVLQLLDLDYDPDALVLSLRPDQRQMVEIARALSLDSRIVILDEPTSSLSDDEVSALFAAVRRLKAASVSTIFVSHRMSELFEICDEITVLRDGRTTGSAAVSELTESAVVDLMVGAGHAAATNDGRRSRRNMRPDPANVALAVRNLSVAGLVHDVSFEVHAGEVVGVAGLVGAGRSELLQAVFDPALRSGGTATVGARECRGGGPSASIHAGMGFVPPDRKEQGLVLSMTVRDNALMVVTHRHARLKRPKRAAYTARLKAAAQRVKLSSRTDSRLASTLSGGNQQKVALVKWLVDPPPVLLLDEPTRGVDVRAKQDIHELLRSVAASGTALLVSSSENKELRDMCDRIIVMARGAVVAIVDARDVDESRLTDLASGHT